MMTHLDDITPPGLLDEGLLGEHPALQSDFRCKNRDKCFYHIGEFVESIQLEYITGEGIQEGTSVTLI